MRKRGAKNFNKQYIIQLFSMGKRPDGKGFTLTAKEVAGLAGCKIKDVYRYRIPNEPTQQSIPMYKNPVIISNVKRVM